MYRSFSNRVFGGVCGGLAARLPLNAWILRGVFIVLSVATLGLFALIYITLWWVIPQESPLNTSAGGFTRLVAAFIIVFVMVVIWLSGQADTTIGIDLMLPGILLVMSSVLLLRQL